MPGPCHPAQRAATVTSAKHARKTRLSKHLVTNPNQASDFTAAAAARLAAAAVDNVELATGDAVLTWQPQGQFDAVVLTGAVAHLPERMLGWLKPGGRLLVIRGASPAQQVALLTQEGAGRYRDEVLLETGRTLDAIAAQPIDAEASARASVAVAEAKVLTTRIALEASEKLFELAGSASTRAVHNLDRHWRNARTHTLHDPVRWKLHLLGNYHLNQVLPALHSWN